MVQNEEPFIRPRRPDAAASLSSTADLPYRPPAPNRAPYPDKYDESGIFRDVWPVTHQRSFHQLKDSLSPFEHNEFEANANHSAEGRQSADQWVQQSRPVMLVELFNGNLVVDHEVPEAILKQVPHAEPPERDEFTHFRYTAVTCDPSDFTKENYYLRPSLSASPRHTELLIIIPCNGAHRIVFAKTVQAIISELVRLNSREDFRERCSNKHNWKSTVLCFVGNKYDVDPSILDFLGNLGLLPTTPWDFVVDAFEHSGQRGTQTSYYRYDDGVCYPRQVKGRKTTARIYEYSTQFTVRTTTLPESITFQPGASPIQTILCLQESPGEYLPWVLAIGGSLSARLCIIVGVGKKVKKDYIYWTWKAQAAADHTTSADGQNLKIVRNNESNVKTWLARFSSR